MSLFILSLFCGLLVLHWAYSMWSLFCVKLNLLFGEVTFWAHWWWGYFVEILFFSEVVRMESLLNIWWTKLTLWCNYKLWWPRIVLSLFMVLVFVEIVLYCKKLCNCQILGAWHVSRLACLLKNFFCQTELILWWACVVVDSLCFLARLFCGQLETGWNYPIPTNANLHNGIQPIRNVSITFLMTGNWLSQNLFTPIHL